MGRRKRERPLDPGDPRRDRRTPRCGVDRSRAAGRTRPSDIQAAGPAVEVARPDGEPGGRLPTVAAGTSAPRQPGMTRFHRDALLRRCERTDRARREVVPERRAVLATEEDDLEMARVPRLPWEHRLQVTFGALDLRAVRQTPARGEPVDVR